MARSPTIEIVAVCLLVFAAQQFAGVVLGVETVLALVALSTPLGDAPWTLVTSVYAHAGFGHLLGNLIVVLLVGLVLERRTTRVRFHAFILVTGAIAGVVQVLVAGGTSVLGISGAAFALLGYVAAGNRLTGSLLDRLQLSTTAQLGLFTAVAVAASLLTYSPGVALVGHFVGALLGLLAGRVRVLRTT